MKIHALDIALLLIYACLAATGNLVLAVGAARLKSANDFGSIVSGALTNPYMWVGLGLYGCAFVLWFWLLSFIPLRYAYPISATSLVIAPLLSGLVTRDFPQTLYWVGLTMVGLGLTLVVTK